jgi:hypothetical protein
MAILAGLAAVFSVLLAAALRRLRCGRQPTPAAGFFHPYTNDGGGGERVLWCAVRAVQELRPGLPCAVFTGDADASPDGLAARALDRFGVRLLCPPQVIWRRGRSGSGPRSEKLDLCGSRCLVSCRVTLIQFKWLILVRLISRFLLSMIWINKLSVSVVHFTALEVE